MQNTLIRRRHDSDRARRWIRVFGTEGLSNLIGGLVLDERTKIGAGSSKIFSGTCYTGRRTEFETVLSEGKHVLAFQLGSLGLMKEILRTIPVLQEDGSYVDEVYLMSEIKWTNFEQVGDTIEARGTAIPIFSPEKEESK